MESKSEHPLAEAVTRYFTEQSATKIEIEQFESITGKGVSGWYSGKQFHVGSRKAIVEQDIQIPTELEAMAQDWLKQAATVIWFADEKEALAAIAIMDKVKENSAEAIQRLKDLGITAYMLTGDNPQTAKVVADKVGIEHFKAETLPEDKAAFIKQLQGQGHVVAMVGDGINDSQALAQADISIAMGKGTDIAMDVAKMTLISSDLMSIPKAILLSKNTVRVIRQNLFWAFIYNVIGIPIAAGVLYPVNGFLLNPMLAGAAMALSSVSVVANSLRLKWGKM
jgi:Cu2+-exporting ATPase